MIIDAHVHSFDRLTGLVGRGRVRSAGFGKVRYGTGEEQRMMPPSLADTSFPGEVLVEYMDWVGIDKAVLLQGNLYGFHNEYVASLVRRWPNRFVGCACVDPMLADSEKVLRHALENLKLRALKLELSEHGGLTGLYPHLRLDISSLQKFWECFAEYQFPLVLDFGPIGDRGYQLDELVRLISSYPSIHPVVICHLGGIGRTTGADPHLQDRWQKFLSTARNSGFYTDIAALPLFFDEEYPCPIVQNYIEQAVDVLSADKLLWGSDLPGMLSRLTYRQIVDIVKVHCRFLNSREKELILGENALRVFRFA